MDRNMDCIGGARRYGAFLPADNPTFQNPDFDAAPFRILVVRLSPFTDVERSTPHLFLAGRSRKAAPEACIDMAFFPSARDRRFFRENSLDFMTGTQSLRPAREFDLILVSNSYLLELINLPVMLRQSGLELWSSQRGAARPLIILGGSNAMASQAIIKDDGDCMVDAVFFGEAEDSIEQIVKAAAGNAARSERLSRLAGSNIQGLWIAGSFPSQCVEKAVLDAPGGRDICVTYPILNGTEVSTGRIQISYGCPAFCSFCFEGYDRKPYRETSLADIAAAVRELKINHGCRDIDLYSFNFNTYTQLVDLLVELSRLFENVSLKSQRVDVLAEDPGLLSVELLAGKRSFTLGVEGISDRCRAILHKSLPGYAVNALMEKLLKEKIRELKLFYILTGHENDTDLAEFRAFVRRCRDSAAAHNRGLRIIFSFGMLIRMPGTPMQYDELKLDPAPWRKLEREVRNICEGDGFEFRMAMTWQEYAVTQVMALGGYWLSEPIAALAQEGFAYDGSLPLSYWERLMEWMQASGKLDESFYGEKDVSYSFPLSFVGQRIDKAFIYEQFVLAKAERDGGYCMGRVSGKGVCLDCGACLSVAGRKLITEKREPVQARNAQRRALADLVARKSRLDASLILVEVPEAFAGVTAEWLNAALMRQVLAAFPEEADNLLSVREMLFATASPAEEGRVKFYGQSVFALKAWRPDDLLEKLKNSEPSRMPLRFLDRKLKPGEKPKLSSAQLDFSVAAVIDQAQLAPEEMLAAFLRSNHVPFTLRRGASGYSLEMTGNRRGREIIAGGSYEKRGSDTMFRLTAGPRFDLQMLGQCFGGGLGAVRISELTASWSK